VTSLFIRTEHTNIQNAIIEKREGERKDVGGCGRVGRVGNDKPYFIIPGRRRT
jgi:hypothetical protein